MVKGLESQQSYEHNEVTQYEEKLDSVRLWVCVCVHWRPIKSNINLIKGPLKERLKKFTLSYYVRAKL